MPSTVFVVAQDILPNDEVVVSGRRFFVFDTLRTASGGVMFLLDPVGTGRPIMVDLGLLDLVETIDDTDV